MTCLDKLVKHSPFQFTVGDLYDEKGMIKLCTYTFGYLERPDWCPGVVGSKECARCWNRRIPESESVVVTKEPILPAVLYRCDRRACDKCTFPECQHTSDITHAVDFHKDKDGAYVEE